MRSLVLPLLLATVPLAAVPLASAAPQSKAAPVSGERGGDPELQSLRRQLAAAVLVAELKLTPDQKKALKSVLGEARKVRDDLKSDKNLAAVRAERKTALRAAVDEVHAKGSVSAETRAALEAGGRDALEETGDAREKMKELRKSAIGILTPEQVAHMKELRQARVKKLKGKSLDKARKLKGDKAARRGKAGNKRLMRLLLSDELAAELDR